METLGVVFLALIGLVVLAAVVMLAVSLPDIRRYQRMRNM